MEQDYYETYHMYEVGIQYNHNYTGLRDQDNSNDIIVSKLYLWQVPIVESLVILPQGKFGASMKYHRHIMPVIYF